MKLRFEVACRANGESAGEGFLPVAGSELFVHTVDLLCFCLLQKYVHLFLSHFYNVRMSRHQKKKKSLHRKGQEDMNCRDKS